MKQREQKKFTQTYVYRDNGDKFFVSTGYRQSSAELNPDGWYFETFAWELDDNNKRTKMIADNSGAILEERALGQHYEVVRQLHETGEFISS